MDVSYDLLNGCQVQGKWDFALAVVSLELIPDYKVALVMEDQKVGERVKENIEVLELL